MARKKRRRRCTGGTTGSLISTSRLASAARRASRLMTGGRCARFLWPGLAAVAAAVAAPWIGVAAVPQAGNVQRQAGSGDGDDAGDLRHCLSVGGSGPAP
jgi:hypothetical protein